MREVAKIVTLPENRSKHSRQKRELRLQLDYSRTTLLRRILKRPNYISASHLHFVTTSHKPWVDICCGHTSARRRDLLVGILDSQGWHLDHWYLNIQSLRQVDAVECQAQPNSFQLTFSELWTLHQAIRMFLLGLLRKPMSDDL